MFHKPPRFRARKESELCSDSEKTEEAGLGRRRRRETSLKGPRMRRTHQPEASSEKKNC